MNYCSYLKKRKNKPYCSLLKKEILLPNCYGCSNKIFKKSTKQIKQHKKADINRFSIITNDLNKCLLCDKPKQALHEVFYGSYRHLSIRYGMVIPLCTFHHTEGLKSVHRDRQLDLQFKIKAQEVFESIYGHDLFMKEFKIDYKEKYKKED